MNSLVQGYAQSGERARGCRLHEVYRRAVANLAPGTADASYHRVVLSVWYG